MKAMHFHPHHSRPQSSCCTMVARLSAFGSNLSITQQTFIVTTTFLGFSFLAFLLMTGGGGGGGGSSHVGRSLHISRRRLSVHSSAHPVPAAFGGIAEVGSLLHTLEMVPYEEQKPGSGSGSGSPSSFMLITGGRGGEGLCSTSVGTHLLTKAYKNKVDYCNMHSGCSVRYILESWGAPPSVLLTLMHSHPSVQWFMWMDTQALFTNLTFTFPFHTYSAWGKHLIVPTSQTKEIKGDWNSINPAIFLVKNSDWSLKFLMKWKENMMRNAEEQQQLHVGDREPEMEEEDKVIISDRRRRRREEARYKDSLVELLAESNGEDEAKVFVEDGYYLHGRGDFIVESYEKMIEASSNDEKQRRRRTWAWPLIVHFSGCDICISPHLSQPCLSAFQRAFHFADNQLLSIVGLQHQHLYTTLA